MLCNDTDNNAECKTLQESAAKNGQVAVNGEIDLPPDTIVHFIGSDNWDTKLSTDINDWEEFYKEHKDILFVPGKENE